MKQITAIEWLAEQFDSIVELYPSQFEKINRAIEQAKEMEKEQMLEFGSKVTDRWGLTRVEPHYIEDEYNKFLQK